MDSFIEVFFVLMIGHAVCDFGIQGDAMAMGKDPYRGADYAHLPPWHYWMTSHALIHAGAVYVILGSFWLAVFEAIAHFCIDYLKCVKRISMVEDQALHHQCKLLYAIWVAYVLGLPVI